MRDRVNYNELPIDLLLDLIACNNNTNKNTSLWHANNVTSHA